MLTVEEAGAIIKEWARPVPPCRVPLNEASGCSLAESVLADMDLPPFDKSLMDGYAVRASECATDGPTRLTIGEEITAGRTPTRPLAEGEAAAIMTGAPLPPGADAVVPHERTRIDEDGRVLIPGPVRPGECRLERGREMKRDQILFPEATRITPVMIGVLASVGVSAPRVTPRPRVTILPTGDELVPIAATPGPGQIRESNATMLAAMVDSDDGIPTIHPVARDDELSIDHAIAAALADRPDVLLLCGGVSAGKRDLVPAALERAGVQVLFHKVRLRPGKPLLFGVLEWPVALDAPFDVRSVPSTDWTGRRLDDREWAERALGFEPRAGRTLIFGLPGNPVSGVVNFRLFVSPALAVLRGYGAYFGEPPFKARLASPYRHRGDRPTCHPVKRRSLDENERYWIEPIDWAGSADLLTVARADGFAWFTEGDHDYETGDEVGYLWS